MIRLAGNLIVVVRFHKNKVLMGARKQVTINLHTLAWITDGHGSANASVLQIRNVSYITVVRQAPCISVMEGRCSVDIKVH